MSLATVASVVGIAAGADTLLNSGGGGSSGGSPGTYIPTGRGAADQTWQNTLSQLVANIGQQGNTIGPGISSGYAALQPGGALGWLPQDWLNMGSALRNQGNQQQTNAGALQNAGMQTYLTSLDPQNALRNQLQQQVTDASRAGTSARGIGMSGNAAGIENQDINNFLINWQNQQLNRQIAGAGALTGAMQGAAGQYAGAGQDYSGAASLQNTAGMFPFAAANAYTGAYSPLQQQYGGVLSSIIPYLNFGNQASQNAFDNQQTGLANLLYGIGKFPSFTQPAAPIVDQGTQAGSDFNTSGSSGGYFGGITSQ